MIGISHFRDENRLVSAAIAGVDQFSEIPHPFEPGFDGSVEERSVIVGVKPDGVTVFENAEAECFLKELLAGADGVADDDRIGSDFLESRVDGSQQFHVAFGRTAAEAAHPAAAVPFVPDLIKFDPVSCVTDDRFTVAGESFDCFVGNWITAAVIEAVAVIENDQRTDPAFDGLVKVFAEIIRNHKFTLLPLHPLPGDFIPDGDDSRMGCHLEILRGSAFVLREVRADSGIELRFFCSSCQSQQQAAEYGEKMFHANCSFLGF